MKRSVNFNGMNRYRKLGANDLVAIFRFLGLSDEQIKARLLEMKAPNNASSRTCVKCGADLAISGVKHPSGEVVCGACGTRR